MEKVKNITMTMKYRLKAIGKMVKRREKEFIIIKMAIDMKEIGKMV